MDPVERLSKQLDESARLLDDCAGQIRDLRLDPEKTIKRIGEALWSINQIRLQIYELRPDLRPAYLNKDDLQENK